VPSHRADTPPPPLRRPRDNRTAKRRPTRPGRRPGTALSAPQVGIAGALGIATIAAPISGAMANPAPKAQVNPIAMAVRVPQAAFPGLPDAVGIGVKALRVVPTANLSSPTPALLAAPSTVIVTRASRSGERAVLPGCDGVARITDAPNGQLPSSQLCTLWTARHRLRADAAVALAKLNVAYKERFGHDICLTDSYRTLSAQVHLRAAKPGLAAVPGTSEHGYGLAVDLCDGVERGSGNSRYQWLRDNGPAYGWDNPAWALPGGSGPNEAWHWEYLAGEKSGSGGE
jgi:zinc D-Ala-D-Ala carboxypeptidase